MERRRPHDEQADHGHDRFKAASAGAGVAQWMSMYAQSDIRSYRTPWFGGTPWQKTRRSTAYWNNSPLKDVANVKTPTLFFVGERDPACRCRSRSRCTARSKASAFRRISTSRRANRTAGAELRHQLSKLNAEIEWFERFATKRPFAPERAPGDEKKDSKTH
jgi:pimeloyl-ACP methyl ester carboxylesterase